MCEVTSIEAHKNRKSGKGLIAKLTNKAVAIEEEIKGLIVIADRLCSIDPDVGVEMYSHLAVLSKTARGYRMNVIELRRMYRD